MAFEKILPLSPADRHPQLTHWNCGPASAENILLSLGIPAEETELAVACRTTENGTDWLGMIQTVLQDRAHHMDWRLVEMPRDPCTPEEKEALWRNVRASIVDAGCPVLINVVAPPTNYPRCSHPYNGDSGSLRYGGGLVYHYCTIFGIREGDDGSRHYLMLDSGFSTPSGSHLMWCSHDQMATLIPPKGYVYSEPKHVGAPSLPGPAAALDDAEALSIAMGGALPIERYRALAPAVREALRQSECNNPRRVAQWFAQIGHESCGLMYMEEIADGSAYEGRQDLGNTQPGDGMRFKGHGPIQITGRENHRQVSEWAYARNLAPSPTYFVDNPNELASDTFGMLGAVWYWTVARGGAINEAADREDIEQVTRLINGGLHGIDDRRRRYHAALQVAEQFVAHPEPVAPPPPPPEPPRPMPSLAPGTPLTGRPFHHSIEEDDHGLLLSMRAEGLLTQRLVFAIAERAGIDARQLYNECRDSF